MKARRKRPKARPTIPYPPKEAIDGIQVVCELFSAHEFFSVRLGIEGARIFEARIRTAIEKAYPGVPIRGLWVHSGPETNAPERPHRLLRYGIQVVCEVFRAPVTDTAVSVLGVAIADSIREVYPGVPVRGISIRAGKGFGSI